MTYQIATKEQAIAIFKNKLSLHPQGNINSVILGCILNGIERMKYSTDNMTAVFRTLDPNVNAKIWVTLMDNYKNIYVYMPVIVALAISELPEELRHHPVIQGIAVFCAYKLEPRDGIDLLTQVNGIPHAGILAALEALQNRVIELRENRLRSVRPA